MFSDQGADRAVGAQPDQRRQLRHHRAETGKWPVSQFAEADVENTTRGFHQILVTGHILGRETGDLLAHPRQVAAIVEAAPVVEIIAIPRGQWREGQVVVEIFSEQLEQLFEQKRRRDHRRTGVMAKAIAFKNLCPAAKLVEAFDQDHTVAHGTAAERRRQATETTTDDDTARH